MSSYSVFHQHNFRQRFNIPLAVWNLLYLYEQHGNNQITGEALAAAVGRDRGTGSNRSSLLLTALRVKGIVQGRIDMNRGIVDEETRLCTDMVHCLYEIYIAGEEA